jgi:hypothetical protein
MINPIGPIPQPTTTPTSSRSARYNAHHRRHCSRHVRPGVRAGDPAALTRLPSEIVQTVEAIWQRALALAAQAAKHDDNAARERLEQIRIENEVRAQSFEMREKEFETAARERERTPAVTCSQS